MKKIVGFEKEIGSDASVSGALGVEGLFLTAEVKAKYPIEKIIQPATKALDGLLDKLEALIPGSWDKPLIEKVKTEYKDDLMKLIAESIPVEAPQA